MAQTASFDVTTGVDLQEVDNAINQAQKEIAQRYDFKGSKASIEFKRAEGLIALVADSDFQMTALFDVVQTKLIKRGVPVKNLDVGEMKQAGGDTVRRDVKLKMQLDAETAKKVAAAIKDAKLKKVQASIQGEQVRVSGPSRDDLQEAIALLREQGLRRRAEVRELPLVASRVADSSARRPSRRARLVIARDVAPVRSRRRRAPPPIRRRSTIATLRRGSASDGARRRAPVLEQRGRRVARAVRSIRSGVANDAGVAARTDAVASDAASPLEAREMTEIERGLGRRVVRARRDGCRRAPRPGRARRR